MIDLPPIPERMKHLALDSRGYPVPSFVAIIDGVPDFRIANGQFMAQAIKQKLCWVCGAPLEAKQNVFVIGPMCSVTKTISEPPSHQECAEFSVKACPFLSMPKAKRRESNLPEESVDPAGIAIRRNPGVACLWHCNGYELFDDGSGGALFRLPNPSRVTWWCEGRKATRDEILESINSGLPILAKMAIEQSLEAEAELRRCVRDAMKLIPVN